jgi:carbon-monoxide dehydrogenase medium subunit
LKPPPFDYVSAGSVDEALAAIADGGDEAKVLAGGQSLIPLLSLRLAHPSLLVDLNALDELRTIDIANGSLRLGSMVRHRDVERSDVVRTSMPLLSLVMPFVGHAAIRSRGTVGGSLAHADPAAELPAVATALDASFSVRSRERGDRTIASDDFFEGYFTTALQPDEVLLSVTFPVAPANTGYAVEEVARRHGDFAMVGAVAAVTIDSGSGNVSDARLALINVAEKPVRARDAEKALVGASPSKSAFGDAAELAVRDLDPSGDLHASPAYRRRVAMVCVRRALEQAARRATESQGGRP